MPDVRRPDGQARRTVRRWLTRRVAPQAVLVVGALLVCSLLIGIGGAIALRPDALTPNDVAAVSASPSPSPAMSPPPTSTPNPTARSATPSTPPSGPSPQQPEGFGPISCGLACRATIAPARLVSVD